MKTRNTIHEDQGISDLRRTWGNTLIRFSCLILILSALVKLVHPPKVVAYMASMGYENSTLVFIVGLELFSALLFLLPSTRWLGLLFFSSYLGGAVAGHVAIHRFMVGGPFLAYMAAHPYIGALVPGVVLVAGWIGAWLSPPRSIADPREWFEARRERTQHRNPEIAAGPVL